MDLRRWITLLVAMILMNAYFCNAIAECFGDGSGLCEEEVFSGLIREESDFADPDMVSLSQDAIENHMRDIYRLSLQWDAKETFQGYCGTCVGCQLYFIGVYNNGNGEDGNAMYEYLQQKATRAGYLTQFFPGPGKDGVYTVESVCRDIEATNPTGEFTYTVFCFHTGKNEPMGMKYGHAMLVYLIYDGMVYWTETSSSEPLIDSVEGFCDRYASGEDGSYIFDGAVRYHPVP